MRLLQNQSWRADEFSPEELGFAKTIANLVHQKYELVMRGTPEYEQKRKVLAGVLIRSSQKVGKSWLSSDDRYLTSKLCFYFQLETI